MIKLYGPPRTRTHRVLWMLEELGLEYENITETHTDDKPIPELEALNPNGKVPTLVDGDTVVWESLAVNLYLADRHDGGLKPRSESERIQALQWSFWAATQVEETLFIALRNRVTFAEDERDPAAADAAEGELARPLTALDQVLAERPFLLGEKFSVGDLNVASILALSGPAAVSLDAYPNVRRWLGECISRPAAREVLARATQDAGL